MNQNAQTQFTAQLTIFPYRNSCSRERFHTDGDTQPRSLRVQSTRDFHLLYICNILFCSRTRSRSNTQRQTDRCSLAAGLRTSGRFACTQCSRLSQAAASRSQCNRPKGKGLCSKLAEKLGRRIHFLARTGFFGLFLTFMHVCVYVMMYSDFWVIR